MLCFMEMKTVKYKVLKGQGMKIQLMKEMLKTQASEIFVAALKNLKNHTDGKHQRQTSKQYMAAHIER